MVMRPANLSDAPSPRKRQRHHGPAQGGSAAQAVVLKCFPGLQRFAHSRQYATTPRCLGGGKFPIGFEALTNVYASSASPVAQGGLMVSSRSSPAARSRGLAG